MKKINLLVIIFLLLAVLYMWDKNKNLNLENENLKIEIDYCCIGTWIDSENGQGYSGPKKNIKDIPASPTGEACYQKIKMLKQKVKKNIIKK